MEGASECAVAAFIVVVLEPGGKREGSFGSTRLAATNILAGHT